MFDLQFSDKIDSTVVGKVEEKLDALCTCAFLDFRLSFIPSVHLIQWPRVREENMFFIGRIICYKNIFHLHRDQTYRSLSIFFADKTIQFVAATVPKNVDPGKGSERKRERKREG